MQLLLSRQAWEDQQVLDHFAAQLDTLFAGVTGDRQRRLLALARRSEVTQQRLANQVRTLQRDAEDIAINVLAIELARVAGYPVDPRTARLHTRTTVRVKRAAASETETLVSRTLWQAAQENFGFDVALETGSGLAFLDNSHLTDAAGAPLKPLRVIDFVRIVRRLDLATQIADAVGAQIKNGLALALIDHCEAQVEFDLIHAHCLDPKRLSEDELDAMIADVQDAEQHWTLYQVKIGSLRLGVPFFVRDTGTKTGDPVYSYLPGRPGGALRRHPSLQSATDSLAQQIRDAAGAGTLQWLLRQMTLRDQQALTAKLAPAATDPNDLSWAGALLHDLFADTRPVSERLHLERGNLEIKSLTRAVQDQRALRFYADIVRLSSSNAAVDRRTLSRGVDYVVSETLEMILLPLPGGLMGAGRLVMGAMFGTLAYQSATAILARQDGDTGPFMQAVLDILDLLISLRINSLGARLSSRRSRQLLARLSNPRIAADKGLQWSAPSSTVIDEHSGLGTAALLRKMLPSGITQPDAAQLTRWLTHTHTPRIVLERIWGSDAPTPRDLARLMLGDQLRGDFDRVSEALDHQRPLPALATEVLPTLLARQLNTTVWIFDHAAQRYSGKHPAQASATLAHGDLVLTDLGHGRYRFDDTTMSLPLLEAVITRHDQLQPGNTLGKVGDFSQDASLRQRAQVLEQQLSATLKQARHSLFQQWLTRRLHAAGTSEPTRNARQTAYSRAITAMATLADAQGRGHPTDAAHLLFAVLIGLPGWPSALAVNLYEASLDRNSQLQSSSRLLHSYGDAETTTVVDFAVLGTRFIGIDQTTGDTIAQRDVPDALSDLVLRTLDDGQRDALGFALSGARALAESVIDHAVLERSQLLTLFAPPPSVPLSEARLQPFETAADLATLSADARGLYTLDGKLYVRIGERFYQALHDHEASSPHQPVMRIVRPSDPVAAAPDNRYVARRPGRSEPVARDLTGAWQGVVIGLAGGMPPRRQGRRVDQTTRLTRRQAHERYVAANDALEAIEANLAEPEREMRRANLRFEVTRRLDARGSTAQTRADLDAAVQQRNALLPDYQAKNLGLLAAQKIMAQALDDYHTTLLPSDHEIRSVYMGEYQLLLLRRIGTLDQVMFVNNQQAMIATAHLHNDLLAYPHEFVEYRQTHLLTLEHNHTLAAQRESDVEALRTRFDGPGIPERLARIQPEEPVDSRLVRMAQFVLYADLLSVGHPAGLENFDPRPMPHSRDFRENVIALQAADHVVPQQRIALLDGLQRQFESTHQAITVLGDDFPEGPLHGYAQHLVSISAELIKASSASLASALAAQDSQAPAERITDEIDLDFLPPGAGEPPRKQPPRQRVIRVHRRGVSTLVVGEVDGGDEQQRVTVKSPDSGEVVSRYRQDGTGAWQPEAPRQEARPDPAALQASVDEHMARLPALTASAQQMHARKDNPTHIVEMLERHVEALLELAAAAPDRAQALRTAAGELSELGRSLMIERYKDPAILDVHRLLFLISHGEVTVERTTRRLPRGKGAKRYFLDVYEIRDARGGADLWHAHFHYPAVDSPNDAYPVRGGHLKTLEQSRLGREHQQRQEQAGLAVERIWRQEIDRRSAAKLFALAP